MDNHWWHLEQTVDGARRRCGVTRCRTSWLVIFCSAKAIVILRAVFWCYYYYYISTTQHHMGVFLWCGVWVGVVGHFMSCYCFSI